jgi:Glycosyl hydrolase catalytic core
MRLALLLVLLLLPAACARAAPVLGVYSEDELSSAASLRNTAAAGQQATGFTAVRQPWSWQVLEPRRDRYDWGGHDLAVAAAARHGLTILPFLIDPPAWAVDQPAGETGMRPPRDDRDLAALAFLCVVRYGPNGSFWSMHPELPYHPIRTWQVWNEPNLPAFWRPAPNARAYVTLLRTVRAAIHVGDAGATVLSAGLPDSSGGVDQLTYLRNLYKGGLHGAADAIAIHAYAPDVAGVVALVSKARTVMRRRGDAATPLWITELGYATGGEDSLFTVTEAQQAELLTGALGMLRGLADPLGLGGLFVFSWRDPTDRFLNLDIWPYHAGLAREDGSPKPVLARLPAVLKGPVTPPPATPVRLRMRTHLGRRGLTVRCSAACAVGAVLVARVPRAGRAAQSLVQGRWARALRARRAVRFRVDRAVVPGGASLSLQVSAVAASGAAARRTLRP